MHVYIIRETKFLLCASCAEKLKLEVERIPIAERIGINESNTPSL